MGRSSTRATIQYPARTGGKDSHLHDIPILLYVWRGVQSWREVRSGGRATREARSRPEWRTTDDPALHIFLFLSLRSAWDRSKNIERVKTLVSGSAEESDTQTPQNRRMVWAGMMRRFMCACRMILRAIT